MDRARKLAIALGVVGAAALLIVWNAAGTSTPTAIGVSDAKRSADALQGQPLQVRGTIEPGTIAYNGTLVDRFVMVDSEEKLLVIFGQLPPDAFGPKEVVVHGLLGQLEDGTVVLNANAVHVGCASKY